MKTENGGVVSICSNSLSLDFNTIYLVQINHVSDMTWYVPEKLRVHIDEWINQSDVGLFSVLTCYADPIMPAHAGS
jgi:hypothetical protein